MTDSRRKMYDEQVERFGDDYPDDLALELAKMIDEQWWYDTDDLQGFPSMLLDNYPGQHLRYRRESYEKAENFLESLRRRVVGWTVRS